MIFVGSPKVLIAITFLPTKIKKLQQTLKNKEESNRNFCNFISVEKDAQLLANRIALLKQEEMKTWKKIEETKKRAKDVVTLKQKNEEKALIKL